LTAYGETDPSLPMVATKLFRFCNANENWAFDVFALMKRRIASIHDLPIKEEELISYSTCVFLQY
jgi:nuclear transport factor 2 (NTF2) superfamily protein